MADHYELAYLFEEEAGMVRHARGLNGRPVCGEPARSAVLGGIINCRACLAIKQAAERE